MDELIKRLNVFRLKEDEYQYIPVYVSELIAEAADAIDALTAYVRQIEELRKDGYYLQKNKNDDLRTGYHDNAAPRAAEGGVSMSDILIKSMKMPVTCCHCPLMGYDPEIEWNDGGRETQGAYICVLTGELIDNTKREDHCPLIEIPPHGRLIDADALMHEFEKAQRTMEQHGQEYSCSFMSDSRELSTEWYCVEDMLENAPTIIEAEEGET